MMTRIGSCLLLCLVFGCADFDPASVRAAAGAPSSAQVDERRVPYDASLPRYVLAVEAVRIKSTVRTWTEESSSNVDRRNSVKTGGSAGSASTASVKTQAGEKELRAGEVRREGAGQDSAGMRTVGNGDGGETYTGRLAGARASRMETGSSGETRSTFSRSEQRQESVSGSGRRTVTAYESYLAPHAMQIWAQLISALANVENFKVMRADALRALDGGRYALQLKKGEIGPFMVQAMITEYNAAAEEEADGLDAVVYDEKNRVTRGVVALDVRVTDGRDGSYVAAFPVQGIFTARNSESGTGMLPIYKERHFAQSVLDQALRAALNEAAVRTLEELRRRAEG